MPKSASFETVFQAYAKWLGCRTTDLTFSGSEGLIQPSLLVKDFLGDATSAILEVITPTERELVTLANSLQSGFRTKTDFESVFFAHAVEDSATSQRVLRQSGFEQHLDSVKPYS